jgi:hypothetical protein
MKTRPFYLLTAFSLILALALAAPKRAAADDEDDPPGRVARLSVTNGAVSFSPAGTDDWVSAVVNRPVTTGDKLWTDRDSRAELHVDSAAFRLAGETGISLLNLNDQTIQLRITEGTVSIRVRRLGDNENIEVDTPNLAFSILRPGRYRISVNEAGDTTIVSVRDGQGEVTGGGSAYTVRAGEQGSFSGTETLDAYIEGSADADDFDDWCDERDLHEDHAVARRYVSDDVIGYEDLDDNGGWRPVPEYGTVWFPHTTIVGWAPYRYGHWAYVAPWGWTWVDDAPWGFAPFHYGRWVSVGGAWGWVPAPPRVVGIAYVRPVYAPALVAWVGGPHFGVGIGVGGGGFAAGVNVGWFPLGPREVFVPSYAVSRAYVNRVNISNTTVNETVVNNYYNTTIVNKNVTVNNVRYVNQGVPGAVTATSPRAFTSAQPVSRNLVAVNQREVASAPVGVSAPSVAPPKQAVTGSGAATNVRPPAVLANRAVVAKTAPPPPPPAFEKQQAAIQANHGQPISMAQTRQIQPARTAAAIAPVKIAPPATPRVATYQQQGSRQTQTTQQPGQNNPNRPSNAGGVQANQGGMQNNQGGKPANARPNNDRPPSARPAIVENPQLEQKHQQQLEQLQKQQDQERQKLEQQQYQQQQKIQQQLQQQANERKQQELIQKQQQLNQQHQQQLEQQAQKHNQEKQQLNQQQKAEHAKPAPPPPKPKEDKPHK